MRTAESSARSRIGSANRLPFKLLLVVVLGLAAVVFGMIQGVRGGNLATLLACVAVAIVATVPILVDQSRPPERRNLLLTMFCLAFMARYVIPPLILYVPETQPIDAPGMYLSMLQPWDVAVGEMVILVALISFLAGHLVPLVRSLGVRNRRSDRDWSPNVTLVSGMGMILFGWLVFMSTAFLGITRYLGTGVLSTFASAMFHGNILVALAYLRHRIRPALLILAFTIPITSLVGFLTGSKTYALLPATFIGLTYVFERRRVPTSFIVVGVLALAVIYPASHFVRGYLLEDGSRSVVEVLSDPVTSTAEIGEYVQSREAGSYMEEGFSAVAGRLDSTGVVSVLVRDTPRIAPYQRGATLVLFFISFVPRALWPEKPSIATGQYITDVYGSGPEIESSTGPSQIGDLYINFSWGGVIVGMFVLGVAFRFVYDFLIAGRRHMSAPGFLVTIAVVYSIVITFETNVALAQARVFFFLVPIIAMDYGIRLFGGSRSVDGQANGQSAGSATAGVDSPVLATSPRWN